MGELEPGQTSHFEKYSSYGGKENQPLTPDLLAEMFGEDAQAGSSKIRLD